MRGWLGVLVMACACYDANEGVLPIVGIWEMDTSLSRHLASEPRRSEMFRCGGSGKTVRCAIVSERDDGMIYETRFEAVVDGPRAPVSGFSDVQEVQLSYKNEPVLDATFYNRGRAVYTWRARRSANGDTLVIDRIDITDEGPRAASTTYRRQQAQLP
jgi:hypothetical protein